MTTKKKVTIFGGIFGSIIALILLLNSFSYVPVQNYGIVFNRFGGGYSKEVKESGFVIHLPFAQKIYDVESNAHSLHLVGPEAINVQTHDGQKLATDVDVQYEIPKENAVEVFRYYHNTERTLRENIQYKLRPVVQRAIEAVTTDYDVSQILGAERNDIEQKINDELSKELGQYNLELTSFKLVATDAEDGIENAINAEAVAQQQVRTAIQEQEKKKIENETKIQQVEAEAEQARIRAEGQAQANELINASVTEELINYKNSEARMVHGWLTTTGVSDVIVDTKE